MVLNIPIYYKTPDNIQFAAYNPEFKQWIVLDLNYFQIRTAKQIVLSGSNWEQTTKDEFQPRLEFFLKVFYLKSLAFPNSQWNSAEKVSQYKIII